MKMIRLIIIMSTRVTVIVTTITKSTKYVI